MCILRSAFTLINLRCFGEILFTEIVFNIISCGILRPLRNSCGIGTHISDKTLNTTVFMTKIKTVVKLLGNLHSFMRLEAKLFGRLLLKS